MGGKISDAGLLALIAQQNLKAVAATEGHGKVPSQKELEAFLATLPDSENPRKNRDLNTAQQSGWGIADLFRRR